MEEPCGLVCHWNPRGRILVKGEDQKGAGIKGWAGTGVDEDKQRFSVGDAKKTRREEPERGRT